MEQVNASTIRVVLCATKFSPTSASAVDVAIALAQHLSARLLLVHVLEPGEDRLTAHECLLAIAERAGFAMDCFVLRGDPGHAIARTAHHEHADLIVVGQGRPSDALVPNDVHHVLERAGTCPVLAVPIGQLPDEVLRRLDSGRASVPDQHCLVCAQSSAALICDGCQNRITAEAVEGKRRVDKTATRGIG